MVVCKFSAADLAASKLSRLAQVPALPAVLVVKLAKPFGPVADGVAEVGGVDFAAQVPDESVADAQRGQAGVAGQLVADHDESAEVSWV